MIKTENLIKQYKNIVALDNLNIQIEKGDIFGYIGPNGAGKTTTIRMLSGLLKPTSGKAYVDGVDVSRYPKLIKEKVGYMPEIFGVYEEMRVWEYLDFFAAAFQLPKSKRRQRVDEILELTGSEEMKDYYVDSLSLGMKRRVGIAKTLVHDPKVLFLDEPASGLDPRGRMEMRQLLKRLKTKGKTILVSSHILPELATICDCIGIIEKGKLLISGKMEEVMKKIQQHRVIEIELLDKIDEVARYISSAYDKSKLGEITRIGNMLRVEFDGQDEEISRIIQDLGQKNYPVLWFREVLTGLEDVYLAVTKAEAGGKRTVVEK